MGRPKKNKRGRKPAAKPTVDEPVEEPIAEEMDGPFEGTPDKPFILDFGNIILEESEDQKDRLDRLISLNAKDFGINWRIPCKSKVFLFSIYLINIFSYFKILSKELA